MVAASYSYAWLSCSRTSLARTPSLRCHLAFRRCCNFYCLPCKAARAPRRCGFHHLMHKTKQWVHKGTIMNKIYSRLGWSLTAIYFAPLLLFSPVKIFEAPATLLLSFVAAPKTNPGTGGNAGLLKFSCDAEACLLRARWLLLISARPRLSKKVSISTALFFPLFFSSP